MKQGNGFTPSLRAAVDDNNWNHQQLLRGIVDDVTFSQQIQAQYPGAFGLFIREVSIEFRELKNNQHQAIDRLCNFRKKIRDRIIFRQKSRQIWAYFGFQLGILSFIYLVIFSFLVFEFDFESIQTSLLASLALYFLGILTLFILIRGKKWRI